MSKFDPRQANSLMNSKIVDNIDVRLVTQTLDKNSL